MADNGRARELPREGFGLRSLRQRLSEAGGTLTLTCTKGLSLEARLPVPVRANTLDKTSALAEPLQSAPIRTLTLEPERS